MLKLITGFRFGCDFHNTAEMFAVLGCIPQIINCYLSDPKGTSWPKTRHLSHRALTSVASFGLWRRGRNKTHTHTHTHTYIYYIYIYIYIYIYNICVCVCVCVRVFGEQWSVRPSVCLVICLFLRSSPHQCLALHRMLWCTALNLLKLLFTHFFLFSQHYCTSRSTLYIHWSAVATRM